MSLDEIHINLSHYSDFGGSYYWTQEADYVDEVLKDFKPKNKPTFSGDLGLIDGFVMDPVIAYRLVHFIHKNENVINEDLMTSGILRNRGMMTRYLDALEEHGYIFKVEREVTRVTNGRWGARTQTKTRQVYLSNPKVMFSLLKTEIVDEWLSVADEVEDLKIDYTTGEVIEDVQEKTPDFNEKYNPMAILAGLDL